MSKERKSSAEAEQKYQDNLTIMEPESQNIVFLKRPRIKIPRGHGGAAAVRVRAEAANVLEAFATETGLSICEIASQLIVWASERTLFADMEVDRDV